MKAGRSNDRPEQDIAEIWIRKEEMQIPKVLQMIHVFAFCCSMNHVPVHEMQIKCNANETNLRVRLFYGQLDEHVMLYLVNSQLRSPVS